MRNLELKVQCPDETTLKTLEQRAQQNNATYIHTLQQRDTYFNVPSSRLKLRQWSIQDDMQRIPSHVQEKYENAASGALLVAYTRPNEESSRVSEYLISPITDPATFLPLLTTTLGIWMIVEKTRVLYRYGQTRIHFDRVTGLGSFIELETEFVDTSTDDEVNAEHAIVKKFLQLALFPTIASSYSDLAQLTFPLIPPTMP